MKKISIALSLLLPSLAIADEDWSIYVGVGYKFQEVILYDEDKFKEAPRDPISARISIEKEDGNIRYGIAHHSQWFTGFPFNDKQEYSKTEVFIDYRFQL